MDGRYICAKFATRLCLRRQKPLRVALQNRLCMCREPWVSEACLVAEKVCHIATSKAVAYGTHPKVSESGPACYTLTLLQKNESISIHKELHAINCLTERETTAHVVELIFGILQWKYGMTADFCNMKGSTAFQ